VNNKQLDKKIVLILPNLRGGGAEKVMITLANDWVKRKIQVFFIVGKFEGEFSGLLSSKVTLIDLQVTKFSKAIPKIALELKKIQPDVVLSTLIYCNAISVAAVKWSGIKTKLFLREATTPSKDTANKSFIFNILIKLFYRFADGYIAVSEGVKKDMEVFYRLSKKRIYTINNPIISEEIFALAKEEIQHNFFSSGYPVITTLGKVSEAKDYNTLIEAFRLANQVIPAKLLILGSTDSDIQLYKTLLLKIKSYNLERDIDFCGFQSNPFSFLAKSDLFVLSSAYEGSPGALVQAMALNGNLISTDCQSGPKEILQNGKRGQLVPVKDPVALADAIVKALQGSKKNPVPEAINTFTVNYSSTQYLKTFDLV
jgi:glycosyltransferase involved in cell wall biosynthesis